MHIENYFNEYPLSVKLTREEYEENCSSDFEELRKILSNFNQEISEHSVDKIEIIGGIVRTPKV